MKPYLLMDESNHNHSSDNKEIVRKNKKTLLSKLDGPLQKIKKFKLLAILLIALSIPVTVTLALQQQNLQKEAAQNVAGVASKPNIVIFMMDDVNPMDGRFFTEYRTPHIYNNFIKKGVNFTNYYVETTLCCPGRAGNLTGQHSQNHKVVDLDGNNFDPATTVATELKGSGYYTMLIGKYLNRYKEFKMAAKLDPIGWNVFDGIFENNGKFYNYNIREKGGKIVYYGSAPKDYSTDVITNRGLSRLKAAPANKPVYLELNPYAIHAPHLPAPRHIGSPRCKNIQPWTAPNVGEVDVSDKAQFIRELPKKGRSYDIQTECEMLLSVDDMVGKIVAELKKEGRYNNTILVLSADNGYAFNEHHFPAKTNPFATHVPLYITWIDGRGSTPRVDNTFLSNIDLAPTFCEFAGCHMGPYPNGQANPDGISFAKLLSDQEYPYFRDAILESQPVVPSGTSPKTRPAWWALRTTGQNPDGLWHYIEWGTGEKELYDLSGGECHDWNFGDPGDPCELDNILSPNTPASRKPAGYQEVQVRLAARLLQLKNEKGVTPILISPIPSPSSALSPTPEGSISATPSEGPSPEPDETVTNVIIKADSYARSDSPNTNYGSLSTISVKASNPKNIGLLKFTLPNLNGKTLTKAVLRLTVSSNTASDVGSANIISIKSLSNSWTENNVTYNNMPTSGSTVGTKPGALSQGQTFEIDITPGIGNRKSGDISFAIESTASNLNNLQLNSKNASGGIPTLILTYY